MGLFHCYFSPFCLFVYSFFGTVWTIFLEKEAQKPTSQMKNLITLGTPYNYLDPKANPYPDRASLNKRIIRFFSQRRCILCSTIGLNINFQDISFSDFLHQFIHEAIKSIPDIITSIQKQILIQIEHH